MTGSVRVLAAHHDIDRLIRRRVLAQQRPGARVEPHRGGANSLEVGITFGAIPAAWSDRIG